MLGAASIGLAATLALAGPAAADTGAAATHRATTTERATTTQHAMAEHRTTTQRATTAPVSAPVRSTAQDGEWRYSDFYRDVFQCEIERIVMSGDYETDGCYYASGLGYYFWYYVP